MIDTGRVGVAAQRGADANEAVLAALKHLQQGMKALRQASKATQEVTGALADCHHDSEDRIDLAALKVFVRTHKVEIKKRVMDACPTLKHCPREGFNLEARKQFVEYIAANKKKSGEVAGDGDGESVSTPSKSDVSHMLVELNPSSPSASDRSRSSRKRNRPFFDPAAGERLRSPERFPLLAALFLKGT